MTTRAWPVAMALLVAGAGSALAKPAPAPKPASIDGKAVFQAHCARCHGANGQGSEGAVPPLAGSEFMREPVSKRVGIVLQGLKGTVDVKGRSYRSQMPSRAHLSDAEVAAVLNYVGRAWGNQADPVSEKQVRGYRHVWEQGPSGEKWREHPSLDRP